jgi:D-alanyl-D-alanine carboxypeptidase
MDSTQYIDEWLARRYETLDIPGFVAAISKNGKIVLQEAYGYSNLETKSKMKPDNIFRIASHSKTFTAVAIMQQQEQGKLKIDDTVISHLLWLAKHTDPRMKTITIGQILSHSSGIVRDGHDSEYWGLEQPFPNELELKADFMANYIITDSNLKFKYSNYAYSLLGLLIKEVSGLSYADYVTKYIIEPLELKNTGPEFVDTIKGQIVTGYTRPDLPDKKRLPIDNIDTHAMASATGFYSTTEDVCSFYTALTVGSGKLLTDESKKEMQRTQWQVGGSKANDQYGFGLCIEYEGDKRMFGHGGGFPGHITKTYCYPEESIVVTVLTNCLASPATSLARGIVSIISFFEKSRTGDHKQYQKYEGRYFNLWNVCDIVATDKGLVSVSPSEFKPFDSDDLEEFTHQEKDIFTVTKAGGYSSESEQVSFEFDPKTKKATSMKYAGAKLWTEEDWQAKLKDKDMIKS